MYFYRTSFSEFSSKNSKDERYKNIEKSREREGLFNEYMVELRKQEKEEKALRREQVSVQFYFNYSYYKSFNFTGYFSLWLLLFVLFSLKLKYLSCYLLHFYHMSLSIILIVKLKVNHCANINDIIKFS